MGPRWASSAEAKLTRVERRRKEERREDDTKAQESEGDTRRRGWEKLV
jgi:hypothetical protein